MTPMDELTELAKSPWGDIPQAYIPANWRDAPPSRELMRRFHLGGKMDDERKAKYRATIARTRVRPRCETPGCNEPHRARGLCAVHYSKWLKARTRESA